MQYSVSVTGLDQFKARLDGTVQKLTIVLSRRINQASLELQSAIVEGLATGKYGIQSRHGAAGLAGSVTVIPAQATSDSSVSGGVQGAGGVAIYGVYHEMGGRGPYEILPKTAEALAWQAYGTFPTRARQKKFSFTADMIFAKRVMHPTIKQRRWFGAAVDDMTPRIREIVADSLQMELFG